MYRPYGIDIHFRKKVKRPGANGAAPYKKERSVDMNIGIRRKIYSVAKILYHI